MEANSLGEWKSIGPSFKTRKSHTIQYKATKIVPQRYTKSNKSPVELQGSAERWCVSIPMSDPSTAYN